MTADPRREPKSPGALPYGDETYADGFAAGYGEGLREGLREVLGHVTRGHTVAELRMLVESRLARIHEDVELKRKSLTNPPQRTPWTALLRTPRPAPRPVGEPALPEFAFGRSYLFREERPDRALAFLRRVAPEHARVLWVSQQPPPELGGGGADRVVPIRPTARAGGDGSVPGVGPGEIAGRIQTLCGGGPPVVVFSDALEYLLSEYGPETTVRFAMWLPPWAQESGGTAIVSLDPGTMAEQDLRRVQKAFTSLV